MELQILHMIQGWRTDWLDDLMVLITKLGDADIPPYQKVRCGNGVLFDPDHHSGQ